jgi:hypothetical protein
MCLMLNSRNRKYNIAAFRRVGPLGDDGSALLPSDNEDVVPSLPARKKRLIRHQLRRGRMDIPLAGNLSQMQSKHSHASNVPRHTPIIIEWGGILGTHT